MKSWLKQIKHLTLGVVVGLLGVVVYLTPLGTMLEEEFGLYSLFHLRGPLPAPQDVMVVAIDQPSATHLDLPIKPSAWPRRLHADLIRQLTAAGARVIVFDLIFDKPGCRSVDNIELAEAMKAAGNVIVVERLVFEKTGVGVDQTDSIPFSIIKEGPAGLLPIFSEAALGHASFPLPKATRVNTFWTFKTGAGDIPTMPVVVLQAFALPVYTDFVRLLGTIHPKYVAALPADVDNVDIEDLVFTLRNIFMSEPLLRQKMRVEIDRDVNLTASEKRKMHALINLYSGHEMRYLNLYGPPRTIETFPYYQVIQTDPAQTLDPDLFKNKVVFVGFSAATQPEQDKVRDDYHTVFSNADGLYISGVELIATAFANLLDDRAIEPFPRIGSVGILFFLGVIIGAVFLLLPIRSATIVGLALIGIYVGSVYYQFTEASTWLPLVIPLLIQVPVALFGVVYLRYHNAKAAFGCFVPRRIVDDIIKNAGLVTTDGQLVYGSCLTTDAEKYVSLANQMDLRALGKFMNDYYGVLFAAVRQHQGIVSDVVGDAMLALWAAPSETVALRKQACLACLDMVQAIEDFNQRDDQPKLPTRMGLHFGEMLLGPVGAVGRYEFRAVGDMVNTSNRIQGLNKYLGTTLLVSNKVVEGLDDFLTRPLGHFLLKGKLEAVSLAELMTYQHAASNDQLWLCEAFASALQAYQLQQWSKACQGFTEILKAFPADGPAQFFLSHCQKLVHTEPSESWSATIQMTDK